jgi:hypothetical protein
MNDSLVALLPCFLNGREMIQKAKKQILIAGVTGLHLQGWTMYHPQTASFLQPAAGGYEHPGSPYVSLVSPQDNAASGIGSSPSRHIVSEITGTGTVGGRVLLLGSDPALQGKEQCPSGER